MRIFYCIIENETFYLRGDDHRHATKVLRHSIGDELFCTEGKGIKYQCRLEEISKTESKLKVISSESIPGPQANLHIAIALTKNAQRIEWFVEKATEIGVSRITPLLTARTEKKNIKVERLQKIARSAMKQSQRFHTPVIDDLTNIKIFAASIQESVNKALAHYRPDNPLFKNMEYKDTVICIGPEGDFTDEEIDILSRAGFVLTNLGQHRLRTETAGIVACVTFNLNGNE